MLVLQRTVGEQVQIGSEIVVTIVQNARGRVRIGIDAPEGTNVRRGELEPQRQNPDPIGPRPAQSPR